MHVAAAILLACGLPDGMIVIVSRVMLSRESLIAERFECRIPEERIRVLPWFLEAREAVAQGMPMDIYQKLYRQSRLVGPYQIDTDRYPFTDRFV